MISFEHIANIKNRINEIEQMVGMRPSLPGADFQKTLAKEIERTQNAEKQTAVGSSKDTGKPAEKGKADFSSVPAGKITHGNSPMKEDQGIGLESDGSFNGMIAAAANKYQVDPKLISAVAEAESGGNQSAVSPAGAVGVMQLMPDTAAALGVNPYDKAQNIEGGAKYLRQMLDNFGGDIRKAVAAYNAGPQAVREYGGVPPYPETQDYVEHVLELYR